MDKYFVNKFILVEPVICMNAAVRFVSICCQVSITFEQKICHLWFMYMLLASCIWKRGPVFGLAIIVICHISHFSFHIWLYVLTLWCPDAVDLIVETYAAAYTSGGSTCVLREGSQCVDLSAGCGRDEISGTKLLYALLGALEDG